MPDGQPLTVSEAQKIFRKKKAYVSLGQIPLPPQLTEPEEVVINVNRDPALRTAAAARFLAHRGGFTQSAQSLMSLIVAAFLAAGLAVATTERDAFPYNLIILGCAALFLAVYWWLMFIEVQAKRLEQYAYLWEQAAMCNTQQDASRRTLPRRWFRQQRSS